MKRILALIFAAALPAANTVLVRTVDGQVLEGVTNAKGVPWSVDGKAGMLRFEDLLSLHAGTSASADESKKIRDGIAAIQGTDRKLRDQAVEELTLIGVPVVTPLLDTYKDTDQHEPRPLYRLFEKVMPSVADGFARDLSLVRMRNGAMMRGVLGAGELEVGGTKVSWDKVRFLAVRQKLVRRNVHVHSIRHCTQIEYFDTGVHVTAASKLDSTARGFARQSWATDSWASDPNGLTKPGAPAYKSHLWDGHPFGALVGRVGAAGEVFFLGKKASKSAMPAGRLMLAINDNRHWQNNLGQYTVELTVTDAYDAGEPQ